VFTHVTARTHGCPPYRGRHLKCFRPFVASWSAPSTSGRSESGRVGFSPTELVHLRQGTHNNRWENAIRPFVVGRKGWLFSDTVKGAIASANLFSIVETAKANGVEPHAYLSLLFAQLPYANTVEDFETLLPWNVKVALAAAASRQTARTCAELLDE
jgi:hypothetical protein